MIDVDRVKALIHDLNDQMDCDSVVIFGVKVGEQTTSLAMAHTIDNSEDNFIILDAIGELLCEMLESVDDRKERTLM